MKNIFFYLIKIISAYFFVVLLINNLFNILHSQELLPLSAIDNTINLENNISLIIDSNQTSTSINILNKDTNLRIKPEDFYYANTPRYTLTGNLPYKETTTDALNIGIVTAGVSSLFIMQHIAQAETIWKDKSEFKIKEDGSYALYADKPGHFIGTYMAAYTMSEALLTAGVDWESSVIGGGILGFTYNAYVEVLDGYGANFGLSPTDMYANALSSGFYIAQYYVPFLQNISPKFTYFPANWHGERLRQPHDFFIDDYSSQTLWLSFNIHNMLDDNLKEYWPQWLDLSIGYAARNLTDPYCVDANGKPCFDLTQNFRVKDNQVWGDPKIIFALDYNLVKLLPDGGSFWNWTKQTLNFFKLPAPAIEIGINGKTRFFFIYPFPIN